ncbi:fungal-specific transcription factor domain-containing protein [Armillaria novae-zelandiae]|uniref:Fungal-specific transcription factor domain-containing protein n=1 Tax=Armillaria novae-zelandiae TaxID=153914 RepID=A0AA39PIW6_9AGAR|nr:fungal-specific transcription factor domain-containing protein [Armillaria novae-zelandiae]
MRQHHDIDLTFAYNTQKRRVLRACDLCRRKKTRCDRTGLPGKQCSNCAANNLICTYVDPTSQPNVSQRYVQCLETKMNEMENVLRKMLPPDVNLAEELEKEPIPLPASGTGGLIQSLVRDVANDKGPSISEDDYDDALESNIQTFTPGRFFGNSSHAKLTQTALDLKNGHPTYFCDVPSRRPEFWDPLILHTTPSRFPQVRDNVEYNFPDNDLLWSLIDIYFTESNIFLPVLHWPSFERSVAESAHLIDPAFATVLLAVCAIASRYSTDPRVVIDNELSSSGWKWMQQILVERKANTFSSPPLLYDCQSTCLIAIFMLGCSVPQTAWTLAGIGLRVAQEAGAHRKRTHKGPNAEAESWRRAFWCLLFMDRYTSSALGRPCAINDEDIDTDLPADCDDEYWDHADPEQAFNQPEGQPSLISYFNCHIRLTRLLMVCLRTLYCTSKPKAIFGLVDKNWEEQIVMELDSALNAWIDTLPDHLRWDPNRVNIVHFKQSAALLGAYHNLRILIHRPFITALHRSSKWPFPSLSICTNAAHSCSHVVDIQHQRGGKFPFSGHLIFNAAVVLLFNIWGGRQSGLSIDLENEMEDVNRCMKILRNLESRWRFAGVLWDILYQLKAGDLPLPLSSKPVSRNKRERDSDFPFDNEHGRSDTPKNPHVTGNLYGESSDPPTSEPMDICAPAPYTRPSSSQWNTMTVSLSTDPQDQWGQSTSVSSQWPRSQALPLPVNGNELGRADFQGQADSDEYIDEQDSQIYGYYEPSSSSLPTQGPSNPSYTPSYGRDGCPHIIRSPPVVHSGSRNSTVQVDDRMRAIWDGVPRTLELGDWDSYLGNLNDTAWWS